MADILNNVPGTDNTGDDSAVLRDFYREFREYARNTREYQQNIENYLRGGNRSSADVRYRAGRDNTFNDFRNPFGRSSSSYRRGGSFGGSEFDRFTDAFEKSMLSHLPVAFLFEPKSRIIVSQSSLSLSGVATPQKNA